MPAPTAWPLVTAVGIALLFAGLVTHLAVSGVGLLILLRGAVGWWREVLPHEKHENVPLLEEYRPIKPSPRTVTRLKVGTGDHRVHIPAEIHPYSAGLKGGLAGGVAMAVVATVFGLISQGSIWYPINLLAAGVMPSLSNATTEQLKEFNSTALMAGLAMHAVVSPLVGILYAVLLPMFPRRFGIWSGLIVPVLWSGLIAAALEIINPAMNARIDWRWFVASQIAFGLAAAYVVARTARIATMQSWSLGARLGLEATIEHDEEGRP
ncbi:MAG TPA: hypothetical protein VGP79_16565 [Bryobacteraceae bacterium]|nr:hypothetical protein [Bryobacteraceae bacterium]